MTIWGTSYFVSMVRATEYYCDYHPNSSWREVTAIVEEKVRRGAIHIGKPQINPGEKLVLIDKNRRYAIVDTKTKQEVAK